MLDELWGRTPPSAPIPTGDRDALVHELDSWLAGVMSSHRARWGDPVLTRIRSEAVAAGAGAEVVVTLVDEINRALENDAAMRD